jgi:CO dehydrogenase/acetyl-CoA synthase delta subunit
VTDILTAISTALASAKTATEIAKLIREADKSLEKAELNLKMADIIGAFSDVRIALAKANESIREKEKEIGKLEELLQFEERLVRRGEAYFEVDVNNEPIGSPYCQHCWEAKRLPVHLSNQIGSSVCPSCKQKYNNMNITTFDVNA